MKEKPTSKQQLRKAILEAINEVWLNEVERSDISIMNIDQDEYIQDWEEEEAEEIGEEYIPVLTQAEEITTIGIEGRKELSAVAVDLNDENKVYGVLYTGMVGDQFSFDVQVAPEAQGKRVASDLIDEAMDRFEFAQEAYGDDIKMVAHVVNPHLINHLNRKGFEIIEKVGSEVWMEYRANNEKQELEEKKKKKKKGDRCTRIAKQKYDKWPSAYASGAVVRCRQGKIWKKLKEATNLTDEELEEMLIREVEKSLLEKKKKKKKAKTDYSKEKKSGLHGWFSRQGGKGKSKGWVDCNTCRKDSKTGKKTCKSCGRKKGEKRAKYPSCRPTPSACGTPGKGEKWGKKK